MTQNDESETNQSIFSNEEFLQLRKKAALTSSEIIQLVSDEKRFNTKIQQLNKIACDLIEEDKYLPASVYLDQAQRILQYAAGCGKTIERNLIIAILNNQACLLQRTNQFEHSANYLQAIIFNISEYLEGQKSFDFDGNHFNAQALQFTEVATYFQRKLSLALYQLRFCALNSHAKNNQLALESAQKALLLLKQVCSQEYDYQMLQAKYNKIQQKEDYDQALSKNIKEQKSRRKLLKQLSNIVQVNHKQSSQVSSYKDKCLLCINQYQKIIQASSANQTQSIFESYYIGNLMQASLLSIPQKITKQFFLQNQFTLRGKYFKVVYLAMAHFTVATQLRFISASKYSLDEQQRKQSVQFRQSKIYHLIALILISRYLPFKSAFFDHAVSSFKSHYKIDLLSQINLQPASVDFSIVNQIDSREESLQSISNVQQPHSYKQENQNHPIEINQQKTQTQPVALNYYIQNHQHIASSEMIAQPQYQRKEDFTQFNYLEFKPKKQKTQIISLSKALESQRNIYTHCSRSKQNKMKSKLLLSKPKQKLTSRKKTLQLQDSSKALYYGNQGKSRSKSKRPLQRKNSKKSLTVKSDLIFVTKKQKNQTNIEEEYRLKSASVFANKTTSNTTMHKKNKNLKKTQEFNIYNKKSPKRPPNYSSKTKKPKNSVHPTKIQPLIKRKSMSKDRYF